MNISHTVLTVTLSQGPGMCLHWTINGCPGTCKISHMAPLAVSVAEHGIRCAKGLTGLGTILWILSSLNGLMYAYNISNVIFCEPLWNIPEVHMYDNVIDFEKYFRNARLLLKFLKIKPSKNFCYMVCSYLVCMWFQRILEKILRSILQEEEILTEQQPLYIDYEEKKIKCSWCKELFCGSIKLKHINQ